MCRREGSGGLRSSTKVCVGERVVEVWGVVQRCV